MKIRLLFGAAALLCVVASHAGYTVRLFWKNETKGTSNAGALVASPGDVVSINFSFHGDNATVNRWLRLQVTLDIYGSSIVGLADANTWDASLTAAFQKAYFPGRVLWQPSDGWLRDNGLLPNDPRSVIVTPQGLYASITADRTKAPSKDIDVKLFQFTIQAGGLLPWKFQNRATLSGLSTRMLDMYGASRDIADNWLDVESQNLISGNVEFEYLDAGAAPPNNVTMRVFNEELSASSEQVVGLDAAGSYSVQLPAGKYSLSVQVSHWLRKTMHVDTSAGHGALADFFLLNGDAYKDGRVDIQDLTAIFFDMGTPGSGMTDLDGDGLVGIKDLTIVLFNYTMTGDE